MAKKKLKPITLKEKNEYIKWQIHKIQNNMNIPNYLCLEFAGWLVIKGKETYISTGFNLTLFPELLQTIHNAVKKEKGTMVIDYAFRNLTATPLAYGTFEEVNNIRLATLEKIRLEINK